jgi:hypothetical protein
MIGKSTTQMRLCPNCANSIEEDAAKCLYCNAELSAEPMPRWLKRNEASSEPPAGSNSRRKFPIPSKFIRPAAMLAAVLIAFLAGGYIQRSELSLATQANLKQLQAKDQMIESQEAQLAQTRQQLNESSGRFAELKSQLEESRKELSAAKQRLEVAARSNANRPAPVTRSVSRAPDTAPPFPAPPPAGRAAEPRVYETVQATAVHESPSSSSRVVTQIARGTRLNVVNSAGEWLEVRSRHGNPPGYVRSAAARPVRSAN